MDGDFLADTSNVTRTLSEVRIVARGMYAVRKHWEPACIVPLQRDKPRRPLPVGKDVVTSHDMWTANATPHLGKQSPPPPVSRLRALG